MKKYLIYKIAIGQGGLFFVLFNYIRFKRRCCGFFSVTKDDLKPSNFNRMAWLLSGLRANCTADEKHTYEKTLKL